MSRNLADAIAEQTEVLFINLATAIKTCDMDYVLCGMPVWKHVYHALHSCDRWFINPDRYAEPSFHELNLNSLDHLSEKRLSREELQEFYLAVQRKITAYLSALTDDMLHEKPEGCKYNRMSLILGQFRHVCCHMGNINATTIIATGKWPRCVGRDSSFPVDALYEYVPT